MSQYFSVEELRCRCGRPHCDAPEPSVELFDMLDAVRETVGVPLIVNSGCRCPWWNKLNGGVGGSEHETGEGADIRCSNSALRYKILAAAFAHDVSRIGIGETFIHLGVSRTHPQRVVWHYYPRKAR